MGGCKKKSEFLIKFDKKLKTTDSFYNLTDVYAKKMYFYKDEFFVSYIFNWIGGDSYSYYYSSF
jgi:hypothetical protein